MTVSQKTALQLKAAGFPPPEPAPGQMWCDGSGFLCCCVLQPKMPEPYNHRLKPMTEKAIQANPDDADAVETFWREIDALHEKMFPKQQFPPGGIVSEKET